MTSIVKQSSFDNKSFVNLGLDLLVSTLAGVIASALIVLGAVSYGREEIAFARFVNSLFLIFSSSSTEPDKAYMQLVILTPIVVSVLTVLITRNLIQRVESRKSWLPATFFVALTATTLSAVYALVIFAPEHPITFAELFQLGPFFLLRILIGSLTGLLFGATLAPHRRIFKITVAIIICAVVAGLFEYPLIWLVVFL
jgi:hypothetical protein